MPKTTPFPPNYELDPNDFQVPSPPDPPSTPIFYVNVPAGSTLHVMLKATKPDGSLAWVSAGRYTAGNRPAVAWADAELHPGPLAQRLTVGETRHTGEVYVQFQDDVEVFMGTWVHTPTGDLHGTPRGRYIAGETNDIGGRLIFVRTSG